MKFNRLRIYSNNRNASMSYNSDPFLIKHCIKPAHFTETQLGQLGVIFRWSVQTGLSTAGRIMLHFPSPLREQLKWLVLSDMWGVLCASFEVLKKFITLACVIAYMCQTTHTHTQAQALTGITEQKWGWMNMPPLFCSSLPSTEPGSVISNALPYWNINSLHYMKSDFIVVLQKLVTF